MSPDYRSDKMETYEGKGIARRAFDAYARGVNKVVPDSWGAALVTASEPAAGYVAREMMQSLLGFWLLWHLCGGFDGLREYGLSRSAIYKKINRFRSTFGVHPDEFELPGVTLHPEEYWKDAASKSPGTRKGTGRRR